MYTSSIGPERVPARNLEEEMTHRGQMNPKREQARLDALPRLLEASKAMLEYIESYAEAADGDDPVHEVLPRYRAAIKEAERA